MINITLVVFTYLVAEKSPIDIQSSPINNETLINFCHFESITTSSSGQAGALFIKDFHNRLEYDNFILCKCLNSQITDAGNAIKTVNGDIKIIHCLSDKSSDKITGESTFSVRSPNFIEASYSNFTNCVAATDISHSGAPSIECTNSSSTSIFKFSHIEESSGLKAIYLDKGKITSINIVGFKGTRLLEKVDEAVGCCFFGNTINEISNQNVKFLNCYSDYQNIDATKTVKTLVLLNKNAHWPVRFACTKANLVLDEFLFD